MLTTHQPEGSLMSMDTNINQQGESLTSMDTNVESTKKLRRLKD